MESSFFTNHWFRVILVFPIMFLFLILKFGLKTNNHLRSCPPFLLSDFIQELKNNMTVTGIAVVNMMESYSLATDSTTQSVIYRVKY